MITEISEPTDRDRALTDEQVCGLCGDQIGCVLWGDVPTREHFLPYREISNSDLPGEPARVCEGCVPWLEQLCEEHAEPARAAAVALEQENALLLARIGEAHYDGDGCDPVAALQALQRQALERNDCERCIAMGYAAESALAVAGSPVHEDEPDDLDHAETEELICAAAFTYCDYNDGSGDDGFPAFALIRIEGQWTAVCAYHAQAAAAGEMERNWIVRDA